MRFECTVMKAKNRDNKALLDLDYDMLEAEKDGFFKNHIETDSYCIFNDVVVVSITVFFF